MSKRNSTSNEIFLLSKRLKFVSTPRGINKALIKEKLEAYGRKPRLMWHFRNDESEFSYDPFKKKSKFDLKRKDAAIELYLSRLEKEISSQDYKVGYSNLMFIRNLQEMRKVLLRKSSKLSSKKSGIGEILATTH